MQIDEGETKVILGTASNDGTYDNAGTVIVTMMEIGLSPVESLTGEMIERCEVSVPSLGFVGETGSPPSEVKIPTLGWEVDVKIDSDPGQNNKRYYETVKKIDTSEGTVEVEVEREENIGSST